MVEVFRATSGDLTATAFGTRIHSHYDPRKEARRFVRHNFGSRLPATVVVLGTGLGYIVGEIREILPSSRIVALSPLDACREEYRRVTDAYVAGDSPDLLPRILDAVRSQDVGGLELIEWAPELKAVPREARRFEQSLRTAVSQRNADIATTGFFGQKYLRNSFRTALFAHEAFSPRPRSLPVCIAASGPSIAEAANWITAYRDRFELWALSSATSALAARGIEPDVVVHQDAGFYAYDHLTTPARRAHARVLMPMTALPPPKALRSRLTLFSQSTSVENDLYEALGATPLRIRETGTVSATATSLALELTSGPVYLVGLDLSQRDIEAHARPHAFEHYLWRQENRLAPVFSAMARQAFEGTRPIGDGDGRRYRTNRGLDAYAAWFRRLPPEAAARLHRVYPSPVSIGATGSAEDPAEEPGRDPEPPPPPTPPDSPALQSTSSLGSAPSSASEPLSLPETGPRGHALRELLTRWREKLEAELSASWTERDDRGGEELCYLISAPDYVAAVAAARRGDEQERSRHVGALAENAESLFLRLEHILDHVPTHSSGTGAML